MAPPSVVNPVAQPRHGIRFTIGQGMLVIALFGVAFAVLPIQVGLVAVPAAILAYIGRKCAGRQKAPLGSIGCLLCLIGIILGSVTGMVWIGAMVTAAVISMRLGVFVADIGRVAAAPQKLLETGNSDARAELVLVEQLLMQARKDGDEFVAEKLRNYKARLKNQLKA